MMILPFSLATESKTFNNPDGVTSDRDGVDPLVCVSSSSAKSESWSFSSRTEGKTVSIPSKKRIDGEGEVLMSLASL